VRVPTTVLAQADSGVGVKNGVNAFGVKNFFGAFAPPFAVLNDAHFLRTLGRRDTIAGMAEAVKVALIRDPEFFRWLETHAGPLAAGDPSPLAELIRRSAQLHLDHIATSGDPFELGSARPLDFGHWAAHKLESLTQNRLRHGEAVAIGIALDTIYSADVGLLRRATVEPVLGLLEALGFRLWDDALAATDGRDGRPSVLDGLAEFREHLGGELTVTLLGDIGRGAEVHEMREALVVGALAALRRRDGAERGHSG
jgi:3-dehydroquinate synthase